MALLKNEWLETCNKWKEMWPVANEQPPKESSKQTIYDLIHYVNVFSLPTDIIMGDAGSISYVGPTMLESKKDQRFIFSPAQADMGWTVPASIGIALSSMQRVWAITGDGSFMSNIQELATIKQHDLNIKIFIINNNGYLSIKNTQTKFFQGRVYGTSSETGLWFPKFEEIANTFGFTYKKVETHTDYINLKVFLDVPGPSIIEVVTSSDQEILPAQALKNGKQAPLHDMYPFLDEDVLNREMINK